MWSHVWILFFFLPWITAGRFATSSAEATRANRIHPFTECHSASVVLRRDDRRLPAFPWHPRLGPRMIVVGTLHLFLFRETWRFVIWTYVSQDVTPYMNPCPYTVSPSTRISQAFNLFRTMGLRHLPVVNAVGEVSRNLTTGRQGNNPWLTRLFISFQIVGIVTRHNLTHEFLVAKLRQHYVTIWAVKAEGPRGSSSLLSVHSC